ncbi:MAG TPA: YceI family protein [Fodinibius sp.]|nr:YceI family protein [Fodinibius sp.]
MKTETIIIKHGKRLVLAGILLLWISTDAASQAYLSKDGHAEFDSSVPLHTFTGVSDQLVGKISLSDSTVDFYLDVHTIKTGIGKRDRDMLETLEAEQYPFVEFFGRLATPVDTNATGPQKVTVEGEFTVHGVTKHISVDGTLQKSDEGLEVAASWTINMENYDIEPPGILFYRVSEHIPISISATLPPQSSN